jgi:hypothetical protein
LTILREGLFKEKRLENERAANNEPAAANVSGFRRMAFIKLTSDGDNEKKQQVNPAIRLPEPFNFLQI